MSEHWGGLQREITPMMLHRIFSAVLASCSFFASQPAYSLPRTVYLPHTFTPILSSSFPRIILLDALCALSSLI